MKNVRKPVALDAYDHDSQSGIEVALSELGLSQPEICLYRSALRLGPRPASTLAKSIHVQRTRVYDLLTSLQSRGLIGMVERNSVRHYAATSPDNLLDLVRQRKKHMMNHLEQLEMAIPTLFNGPRSNFSKTESRTLRGAKPVQEAFDKVANSCEGTLLSVGDIEGALAMKSGMSLWAKRFRQNRISRQILLQTSRHGSPDLIKDSSLRQEILISPEIPEGTLLLVANNTLILLEEGEVIQATCIESTVMCLVVKSFYNSWRQAVASSMGNEGR